MLPKKCPEGTPAGGPFVWCNGDLVPAGAPALLASESGFLLGEGVYETLRALDRQPVALTRHLSRLTRTLHDLAIPWRESGAAVGDAVADLLSVNGMSDARLRLTVTRGPVGAGPTVLLQAMPLVLPTATVYASGVSVVSVPEVPHPRLPWKTTSRIAHGLLGRRAEQAGAYEGLFMAEGAWIEGGRTNLVARIGRRLLVSDSPWALPGIAQEALLAGAAAAGYDVSRTRLLPADLGSVDGLYLTNAIIEVLPVATIDGAALASPGPEARRLRDLCRSGLGLAPLLSP